MPLNSDDAKRPGSTGFRHAGIGMAHNFKCSRCDQPKKTEGRKLAHPKLPALGWVCKECQ